MNPDGNGSLDSPSGFFDGNSFRDAVNFCNDSTLNQSCDLTGLFLFCGQCGECNIPCHKSHNHQTKHYVDQRPVYMLMIRFLIEGFQASKCLW